MIYDSIVKKIPIDKGWSKDQKYCITSTDGAKYLLRISSLDRYDSKKNGFEMTKRVAALGVPMCQPVEFGTCAEGVYSIQGWIDGNDAEAVIGAFSQEKQYAYGVEAGRVLKKIHSIPAPETQEDWEPRFNRKIDQKRKMYEECEIQYEPIHFMVVIDKTLFPIVIWDDYSFPGKINMLPFSNLGMTDFLNFCMTVRI